jgi:hypothetical protein
MTVQRSYGMPFSTIEEVLAVPQEVRDAHAAYVYAVIKHYDTEWTESGIRFVLREQS